MNTIQSFQQSDPGPLASAPVGQTQGAHRATGVCPTGGTGKVKIAISAPDPEVPVNMPRRRFTAAFKLRVLQKADLCQPGQIGALLRREGLYSSHLTTWRRQREGGILNSLVPKKRGRKSKPEDPSAGHVAQLEKQIQRLQHQLQKARIIIEAQKKISEILGIDQILDDSEDLR
jgi:transposase-like protein